eukprot:m.220232 g.220232  ORF g.220232 m.220232 type:complete len:425 (+) comp19157_c0_seq84:154-1428(+)
MDTLCMLIGVLAGVFTAWAWVRFIDPIRSFNAKFTVPYNPEKECGRQPDIAAAERNLKQLTPAATGKSYVVFGTGGVGVAMIEALWNRGERNISGFDLNPSRGRAGDSVQLIKGDITDKDAVQAACAGADVVFHTVAAITYSHMYACQWPVSYRINVQGTENVIAACKTNGVSVLIFTSSSSVVLDKQHISRTIYGDESMPLALDETSSLNHYMRSKAMAESLVIAANSRRLRTGCIRPTSGIFGPRDTYCMQQPLDKMEATAIGFEDSIMDWVYVENVVLGHLLLEAQLGSSDPAVVDQVAGESFCINNGEPLTGMDFNRRIAWAAGSGFRYTKLPPPIMTMLCTIVGVLARLGRGPKGDLSQLSPCVLDFMTIGFVFSGAKAQRLLGYTPAYTVDEAIAKTVGEHAELFPESENAKTLQGRH